MVNMGIILFFGQVILYGLMIYSMGRALFEDMPRFIAFSHYWGYWYRYKDTSATTVPEYHYLMKKYGTMTLQSIGVQFVLWVIILSLAQVLVLLGW